MGVERGKERQRIGKDGVNCSVNIETPLEESWRAFVVRVEHVIYRLWSQVLTVPLSC